MKCPGQDMQYWDSSAIFDVNCPECGKPVEFYKDDTSRKCGSCGHRFVNPKMDFGCAAYCQFAEQCVGTLPEEFSGARETLLKEKVAVEIKRHYNKNFKRISQVLKVARYAEDIGKAEQVNMVVVLCAAYLHGINKQTGEEDARAAEATAVPEAAEILGRLGAADQIVADVCLLLESIDTPECSENREAQVIKDALLLARLDMKYKTSPPSQESRDTTLNKDLHTDGGRKAAMKLFERTGN